MEKTRNKNPRGLFERPTDSGVWWINYYVKGKQHREKVGKKSAAIALYRKRKEDERAGRKLPELRNSKIVTLSELIDDVLEFTKHHNDRRNYISKAEIVRRDLGSLPAEEITPQELTRWLNRRCKSPATYNRYKAFISLCYREGEHNRKVDVNPARKVRHRKEENRRIRFLSGEEYDRLHAAIKKLFPEHLAEFVVSVHTGMRLSEQYTVEWSQVHLDRRAIDLTKTKNGYQRTVHLNETAIAFIQSARGHGQRPRDRVFPRDSANRFDNRSWFHPCLVEAGITDYVWHSNRHTFCSWLAMAGASTKEIQEAAGHRTIAMAARYAHLSPAHRLSVVERISTIPRGENQHAPLHAPGES
jgi:integrase